MSEVAVCGFCGAPLNSVRRFNAVAMNLEAVTHAERDYVNAQYWAEKLQGLGSDIARSYSHDAFRERLRQWVEDWCDYNAYEVFGDYEAYPDLIWRAIDREFGSYTHYDEEARQRVEELQDYLNECLSDGYSSPSEYERVHVEMWEWDLREYDHRFLWCCWAIVRGISRYRAAQRAVALVPA